MTTGQGIAQAGLCLAVAGGLGSCMHSVVTHPGVLLDVVHAFAWLMVYCFLGLVACIIIGYIGFRVMEHAFK